MLIIIFFFLSNKERVELRILGSLTFFCLFVLFSWLFFLLFCLYNLYLEEPSVLLYVVIMMCFLSMINLISNTNLTGKASQRWGFEGFDWLLKCEFCFKWVNQKAHAFAHALWFHGPQQKTCIFCFVSYIFCDPTKLRH